jgi:hypothetical protein
MKDPKRPVYVVVASYPFGAAGPSDVINLVWRDIDGGTKLTPDGALARAKRHVKEFPAAVCLVRKDGQNIYFVQKGATWDVTGEVARVAA